MTMISNNNNAIMADTSLTKVFVGGLAWETPKEALREHFHKYGEILEAVIISDKLTGRSKGYGFVTFKDAEAAKKACEDATPIINGRRANCNLAALGARRPRSNSSATSATNAPPPQQGVNVGPRAAASTPPQINHVQWYYPARTPPPAAAPFHHEHHQAAIPFYGYSPTYIATTDMNYNHKMGGGSTYMNGQYFGQVYPNTVMAMYPAAYYHYHHQSHTHTMGLPVPAHMYSPTAAAGPIPALISKPGTCIPNAAAVCLAVE